MRSVLLWASENKTLKERVPRMRFVQKALKKFMPGEKEDDAINASKILNEKNIKTVFTHLGENLSNLEEAKEVTNHYLKLIDKISAEKVDVEVSLKLTQLGFDLSEEETFKHFLLIADRVKEKLNNNLWIDMEGSSYTKKTIEFYEKVKKERDNIGLCLQAYLFRTHEDINELIKIKPAIRLVKGAYREPAEVALKDKFRVDENYLDLSQKMLNAAKENGTKAVFGTHDLTLIKAINEYSESIKLSKDKYEFHMLYGIKSSEQYRLANEGYKVRVLISYGSAWYPWYMRRLAERPANVTFVLKNLFSN